MHLGRNRMKEEEKEEEEDEEEGGSRFITQLINTDGPADGRKDERTVGQTDRWTDGRTYQPTEWNRLKSFSGPQYFRKKSVYNVCN